MAQIEEAAVRGCVWETCCAGLVIIDLLITIVQTQLSIRRKRVAPTGRDRFDRVGNALKNVTEVSQHIGIRGQCVYQVVVTLQPEP
jgi:hypothetical protein